MKYIYRVLHYMAWFWFMEWLIFLYIINRIIHGRFEIWNLSSRVYIRYLTRSLRSLVRYRGEHSKINSISPRAHVLFPIYCLHSEVSCCNNSKRKVDFIIKGCHALEWPFKLRTFGPFYRGWNSGTHNRTALQLPISRSLMGNQIQ